MSAKLYISSISWYAIRVKYQGGMRKFEFQNGEFYHVFNRGVDRREIFCCDQDYIRFLVGMREFNRQDTIESLYRLNESRRKERLARKEAELPIGSSASPTPLVEIICYALIPNHYHFVLKQLTDEGIMKFMQKLGTSYSKYFNFKYKRTGILFQGKYKAIHITHDPQLLRLSSYVNANAQIHKIASAENYPWSSYPDYLSKRNGTICQKDIILNEFKNTLEYKKFTDIIIKESQETKNENHEL